MRHRALSACLAFGFAAVATAQVALRDGDRIVFYGDSITDNGPYTYYVETYVLDRFPNLNVRFFNAGVGGDRVSGGWMGPIDPRLTRDLFSRRPTVVTVMLGMNDAGYQAFNPDLFVRYQAGYRHIADRLKAEAPEARVWLIQPSPFDDFTRAPSVPNGGYNAVLKRYSSFVADLARERGFRTIDLNTPVADELGEAAKLDPKNAPRILGDRVHPGPAGHLVMAASVIRGWGMSKPVSLTDIDAEAGTWTGESVQVSDLKRGGTLSWSSLEGSLPFWIDRKDEVIALALKSAPIDEWFGPERLVVRKLQPGDYRLSIDGKPAGQFSAEALASGINLATLDTPMVDQARRVFDLSYKRSQMKYGAWRQIEFALGDMPKGSRDAVMRSIDKFDQDIVRRQHETAKPARHRFELTKV